MRMSAILIKCYVTSRTFETTIMGDVKARVALDLMKFTNPILACDGRNLFQVSDLPAHIEDKALEGLATNEELKQGRWDFVHGSGCESLFGMSNCQQCLNASFGHLDARNEDLWTKCLRCEVSVSEKLAADTEGFCSQCDTDHFYEWCMGSPNHRSTTTYSNYKKNLNELYLRNYNNAFARKNGLGTEI